MPTLKELRTQLKKSMKPISKMSRDEVVLMLEKHKVEPVEKPVEKPTKKAVEKEVKKQVKKPVEEEVKKGTKKPIKKEAVKLPESSSDEEPVEKVKKVKEVKEDKSSSSASLTKKQMWGELRKSGLSSAEAWSKLRE